MNRIGLGYDIHPLATGRKFLLGGVVIPSEKGPVGHSDGDCLYHALTDALLGALGLGDIGRHFPDNDPRWKDADSTIFLKETKRLMEEKKFKVENIDANIHLESPKIVPHFPDMIKNIAEHLKISEDQINLKAKRGEGLDAVGKGEAIAAQVIVNLCR